METLERNKAVVRRMIEEWWGRSNLDVVDEVIHPTFVDHGRPGQAPGPDGVRQGMAEMTSDDSFSDLTFTIEDVIAEGDRVAVRGSWQGRHTGTWKTPFGEFAPTGKTVSLPGVMMWRLEDGKLAEQWGSGDTTDMLRDLGLAPSS